jgi:pimeloyl-ACP methyl ester carboxylesterase
MGNSRLILRIGLTLIVAGVIAGLSYSTYRETHRRHFTYVIVHGAYGGGWAFGEVDAMMTADGQRVFRPTLTGQGEKMHLANPDVNLETHIQDIVNTILFEKLDNVVLVGHSYGGMVITGVVDRIPQRIKCVIYLDAILPEDGESADTADNGILHHSTTVKLDVHGSIPTTAKEMSKPLPHDEPMPAGAFRQPISLKNQTVARAIPTSFILFVAKGTKLRNAHFYPFYQRAIARGWHTETFTSDHNAQWSHPRELADLLERLPD